jgi:hypothetical protein
MARPRIHGRDQTFRCLQIGERNSKSGSDNRLISSQEVAGYERVLEFGVIVVTAELSVLFCFTGYLLNPHWRWSHAASVAHRCRLLYLKSLSTDYAPPLVTRNFAANAIFNS